MKGIKDDGSKLAGILMCYKYFQPLSKKILILVNKGISKVSTRKEEKVDRLDSINAEFDYLRNQVENMSRLLANKFENN